MNKSEELLLQLETNRGHQVLRLQIEETPRHAYFKGGLFERTEPQGVYTPINSLKDLYQLLTETKVKRVLNVTLRTHTTEDFDITY